MALTFLPGSLVVESDSSILDLPAFHAALRDWEDDATGMLYPPIHTWKALDLGAGASFYQADFVNGWRLRFPAPGSYSIAGNLNATILPVAGVYVERKTSAAFVTTAVGGGGPSADAIAAAVRSALTAELQQVTDVARIHGLVSGQPLVVTPSSRVAGPVTQTIDTAGDTVTVTRGA